MAGKTFVPGEKLRAADMNNLQSKLDPYPDYELIGVQALSGSVTTVDLSAGYNSVWVWIGDADTTAALGIYFQNNLNVTFNSDTGSNYGYITSNDGRSGTAAGYLSGYAAQETYLWMRIDGCRSTGPKLLQSQNYYNAEGSNYSRNVSGVYFGTASVSSMRIELTGSPGDAWTSGSIVVYGSQ